MNIVASKRIEGIGTYYFANKLGEIAEWNSSNDTQILNLGIGSPDLLPPRQVIEALQEAAVDKDANRYQSYRGIPELRDAFANWYKTFFNVRIDSKNEILPLMGAKEGIMHISMSLLNPGDIVLVPNPGYPTYSAASTLAGATVRYYSLSADKNWLPDLKALASQDLSKVKLMWVNYPHMPTGAKADPSFFRSLIDFGQKHNILICNDNPYVFILNDAPLSIMQFDGASENCLELLSLSKCYNMAGWRIGALAGKKEILDLVLRFKSNMDSGMYRPLQIAAVKALSMGQEWMESLNNIYGKRKKIAHLIMDELGAKYETESAGLFVWGKVDESINSVEKYCDEILYGAKVFVAPGHIFGSNGEGYIRISLCNTNLELEEALGRIKKFKENK